MFNSEYDAPTPKPQEYTFPDGTSAGMLTADEATELGFCPGCGGFVAGVDGESFYMRRYGICSNCADEFDIFEDDSEHWS